MRKFLTKSLTITLMIALCVSFASCREHGDEPQPTSAPLLPDSGETELSVSGVKKRASSGDVERYTLAENPDFFELKEASAEGGTVTMNGNTVSSVTFMKTFAHGAKVICSMKLKLDANSSPDYSSLYLGLRLPEPTSDATARNGVWIALQKNKIGIRAGNWTTTRMKKFSAEGVDFSVERTVVIIDDTVNNVITVEAENDSGTLVVVANFKIDGGNIGMYFTEKDDVQVTSKGNNVPETGYMRLWLHHMKGPATVKDLKIEASMNADFTTEEANMMNSRDVLADTWVASDAIGRAVDNRNTNPNGKKVGIFYFLWHDPVRHRGDGKVYNHAEAFETGGRQGLINMLSSGPMGFAHYWAEPYFGYYRSDDEWIIRKHTYMLCAAGIDFIFIDATNGITYQNSYEKILAVWTKMRQEGLKTPQICFHCGDNIDVAPKSYTALWRNLYSVGLHKELWFLYDGKPLIFMPKAYYEQLPEEQRNFFTVRHSWANTRDSWYKNNKGVSCWPWADMYPQGKGLGPDGKFEQMIVMSGFWVNGSYGTNAGRSYSYKAGQPKDSDFGFNLTAEGTSGLGTAFEEQFDYAIDCDPGLIMLVGWNEWWAGRWEAGPATGQTIANTYTVTNNNKWTKNYFVDNFNPEFSRDIEPVKGYYTDNYYYQMAENVRDYKGSREQLPAFGQKEIDVDGPVTQWDSVGPEYRDYAGDTAHRDATSYVGDFHYVNETGRNDIINCKVSVAGGYACFLAECAEDITTPEGTNWMNLFVNSDADYETGWNGYDFVINRTRENGKCSVLKFKDNSWETVTAGEADIKVDGKYIVIKVDAKLLELKDTFDFKWADNSCDSGEILDFIDKGDVAPSDRFNFRYTGKNVKVAVPALLGKNDVVLKAGSNYAFASKKMVRLSDATTKAQFFGDGEALYLPLEFAENTLKLNLEGEKRYNHYGVLYVDVKEALEKSGKTLTETEGLLVISDKTFTEDECLELYRALY